MAPADIPSTGTRWSGERARLQLLGLLLDTLVPSPSGLKGHSRAGKQRSTCLLTGLRGTDKKPPFLP